MHDFLTEPGFLGTHATLGADVSYILAVLFTVLFLIGWYLAAKHHGSRHHGFTLWATIGMFAYFTVYYLTRRLGVLALEGKEGFGGSDWMYHNVFSPILTVHILLVTVGLVLSVYMIILGYRASYKIEGKRLLREGSDLFMSERSFYKYLIIILAVMALLAFIRCSGTRCVAVYAAGYLIVAFVFLMEKGIEKIMPVGAKRHRFLGRLTMAIFIVVLITSTLTYLFLYILYTPRISGVPYP